MHLDWLIPIGLVIVSLMLNAWEGHLIRTGKVKLDYDATPFEGDSDAMSRY